MSTPKLFDDIVVWPKRNHYHSIRKFHSMDERGNVLCFRTEDDYERYKSGSWYDLHAWPFWKVIDTTFPEQ